MREATTPTNSSHPDAPLDRLGNKPKIAILRGGGFGDFLVTTPALASLRQSLPCAHITLITNSLVASLAGRYAEFDRVMISPPSEGLFPGQGNDLALSRFLASMRHEQFDLALQWHGGGRYSNPYVRRLGARISAGFRTEDAEPLDYSIPWDYHQHEILRYLDLIRLLGIEADTHRMRLPVLQSDEEELERLRGTLEPGALRSGRHIGLHASSGSPNRRWAPERFAWVVDRLIEEFDLEGVVVTAGPGQEADSARVVESMAHRDRSIDLGGGTSLGALIALIQHYRFFLSNDSGPGHMAVALDTPSVVVFGAAQPFNWAPLDRAWHRFVADWASPCRTGIGDACPNSPDVPCLAAIQPEMVLAEARQLLRQTGEVEVPLPLRTATNTEQAA